LGGKKKEKVKNGAKSRLAPTGSSAEKKKQQGGAKTENWRESNAKKIFRDVEKKISRVKGSQGQRKYQVDGAPLNRREVKKIGRGVPANRGKKSVGKPEILPIGAAARNGQH